MPSKLYIRMNGSETVKDGLVVESSTSTVMGRVGKIRLHGKMKSLKSSSFTLKHHWFCCRISKEGKVKLNVYS